MLSNSFLNNVFNQVRGSETRLTFQSCIDGLGQDLETELKGMDRGCLQSDLERQKRQTKKKKY